MTALITVDYFGFANAESSFQAVHDKGLLQRVGKLIIDNPSAVPINDDEKIHESFFHSNICDINTPDLIRAVNEKVSEQVGTDVLSVVSLAEIRLRIDGVYAHIPHHSADLLAVNAELIIPTYNLCNRSIAPSGMSRMQFIDSTHDKQVLIRDCFLLRRLPVYAGSIDAEEIRLTADGDLGFAEINVIFSSSWVRESL